MNGPPPAQPPFPTEERREKQGGSVLPKVTICVLTYGNYPQLARQSIESVRVHCQRSQYRLVVGANAVGAETYDYFKRLEAMAEIDRLIVSPINLNKCPMMRRMFESIDTEFIWWFDDDSHIAEPTAFARWLDHTSGAPEATVLWGEMAYCGHKLGFTDIEDVFGFVRTAPWYRGLPPPSWYPGGKGEFNFQNKGTGDGRWFFVVGGCWLIRTRTVRALDWPDKRLIKLGDDVFLGEAIRQNGWALANVDTPGVAINTEARRGEAGDAADQSRMDANKSE